jgi:hypothetical protein
MLAARCVFEVRAGVGVEHQIELTAESLWGGCRSAQGGAQRTTYGTWFGEARGLEPGDERFVLAVPNDFTATGSKGISSA